MNRRFCSHFTHKLVYVSILGLFDLLLSACGGANANGTSSAQITGPVGKVKVFTLASTVGSPEWITLGPDGNLWFTETQSYIGRITPSGSITEFSAW